MQLYQYIHTHIHTHTYANMPHMLAVLCSLFDFAAFINGLVLTRVVFFLLLLILSLQVTEFS